MGYSVTNELTLHQHALHYNKIDISSLLVFAGADLYFKDKDGV